LKGIILSQKAILEKLADCVSNYDIDGTKIVAEEVIKHGINPVNAVENGLAKGLRVVGDKFGDGGVFLTELMMAAEAMFAGLEILKPELTKSKMEAKSSGRVVIGTVQGDIHDLGKNIVAVMLVANGFEVIDLGVDVPVDKFVEAVKEKKPDMVGLSSLMTTTMVEQEKVIEALRGEDLNVKVLVGGAPITGEWAEKIGADGAAGDASEAAKVALALMKRV
jgi:corrinoid protein of di/trimethylamine methyltransferase